MITFPIIIDQIYLSERRGVNYYNYYKANVNHSANG